MTKVGMVIFRNDLLEWEFDFHDSGPYEHGEVFLSRGPCSWAAATKGKNIVHTNDISETLKKAENCDIIVLSFLGNEQISNINDVMALSIPLKEMGKPVFLLYGESLGNLKKELNWFPDFLDKMIDIVSISECDGICSPKNGNATQLWKQIGLLTSKPVEFIPFCFDKKSAQRFRIPIEKRKGIVIPRSMFVIDCQRCSIENIIAASRLNEPTSIIWQMKFATEKIRHLKSLFPQNNEVEVVSKPAHPNEKQFSFTWHQYLEIIAKHRICINIDLYYSDGGFAADSVLTNVPCLGGNGHVSRMVFSDLISDPSSIDEIVLVGEKLLKDDSFYEEVIKEMDRKLENELSFETNKEIWEKIYDKYTN